MIAWPCGFGQFDDGGDRDEPEIQERGLGGWESELLVKVKLRGRAKVDVKRSMTAEAFCRRRFGGHASTVRGVGVRMQEGRRRCAVRPAADECGTVKLIDVGVSDQVGTPECRAAGAALNQALEAPGRNAAGNAGCRRAGHGPSGGAGVAGA